LSTFSQECRQNNFNILQYLAELGNANVRRNENHQGTTDKRQWN
jgi:hypothetical protein